MITQGGDTDTNACIIGGLLGAAYGINFIPFEYIYKQYICTTEKG